MDITEASAAMEASGLVDQQDGMQRSGSRPRRDGGKGGQQSPASDAVTALGDQLRDMALKAQLQSLSVASGFSNPRAVK